MGLRLLFRCRYCNQKRCCSKNGRVKSCHKCPFQKKECYPEINSWKVIVSGGCSDCAEEISKAIEEKGGIVCD